jgi:hypothetical protein
VEMRDGKRVLVKAAGHPVCRCMLPNCTHYISLELAIGRKSLCWGCGSELILTAELAKSKKPCHPECRAKRRSA